ncbi:amino acid ABC transporter permease [Rhizobium sp. Leaf384]|uniref:amino acid ABC transporter permease n=1 Tax=unclassified Rhizobium TaxID=2613769 RepID=UPI000712931D|nr:MULTISPECIES: amino acid ABC transporter permease [unclassified Rhizobium]KQS80903.1 amino acid ABC transporter permease [Rhizobium sp. Leaf384]KQS86763.1 amino acid ABC transporter permease [Rhizobium sp. Leaf383]
MSDLFTFWLENLPTMIDGLIVSLEVTGVALAVGIPLGLLLALGVQSRTLAVRWATMAVVEIGRGAPALIMLQFFYFGLPQAGVSLTSFSAAAFALAWTTSAYTSEIIRAGLEAVPYGQKEAAAAVGFTHTDALRYIIVPQGLRVAAPALLGFSILMLQATSLCFAIALPELLSQAYMIGTNTFQYLPILILAGILYALICIPATIAVSLLERSLSRHTA